MFAEIVVGLGFLQSISYIKPIPTHEKLFAVGKSAPNDTFDLKFLVLSWPWVVEFDGFIVIFGCFPTQHNLVHRKHPVTREHNYQNPGWTQQPYTLFPCVCYPFLVLIGTVHRHIDCVILYSDLMCPMHIREFVRVICVI